jgi:hypothetical protein
MEVQSELMPHPKVLPSMPEWPIVITWRGISAKRKAKQLSSVHNGDRELFTDPQRVRA